MTEIAESAIVDFEIYVLMTMKLRMSMSQITEHLHAKLSEHGLSVEDGERARDRVASSLGDEASYFRNLKVLLTGTDSDATSLEFASALWPDFDFKAVAAESGSTQSMNYRRMRGQFPQVESPKEFGPWEVDVNDFARRFGPLTPGPLRPLNDQYLANYQEYGFSWNGRGYGAGFSWGLFMFAAQDWD